MNLRKTVLLFFLLVETVAFSQSTFTDKFCQAAITLTAQRVSYDPTYFKIDYPNGDVPADKGVCTDVVVRAYRKVGVDLQRLVHEDMKANFTRYPKIWGLKTTDTNIDHRRVPNLMTYFSRHGSVLKISNEPAQYQPGDIVTWDLGRNTPHIGIIINRKSDDNKRYLIVHNIGSGQEISDCLFNYKITGHYRFEKMN
jgi:uncharacterized protein YijF (DUF1287 family)